MSIANELSSEVAVWLLARRADQTNPNTSSAKDLKRIVLELHTTLQRLKAEERAARRDTQKQPANLKINTAGSH